MTKNETKLDKSIKFRIRESEEEQQQQNRFSEARAEVQILMCMTSRANFQACTTTCTTFVKNAFLIIKILLSDCNNFQLFFLNLFFADIVMECRETNDDEGSFSLSHPHLETMQIVHTTHQGKTVPFVPKLGFY